MQELDTLIQNIYEDKVLGKVSEDVAMKLIAKYEAEQKELSTEVTGLEEKFKTIRQDEEDVALFMERLRKYTDLQELTREMCLVSRLMPMSRGSPVRSTSTTNCSMNNSKTRQACFKAYLRY